MRFECKHSHFTAAGCLFLLLKTVGFPEAAVSDTTGSSPDVFSWLEAAASFAHWTTCSRPLSARLVVAFILSYRAAGCRCSNTRSITITQSPLFKRLWAFVLEYLVFKTLRMGRKVPGYKSQQVAGRSATKTVAHTWRCDVKLTWCLQYRI